LFKNLLTNIINSVKVKFGGLNIFKNFKSSRRPFTYA